MAWRAQSLPRQLDWSGPGSATRCCSAGYQSEARRASKDVVSSDAEDIACHAFRAVDHKGKIGLEHLVGQGVDVPDQRGIVFPPVCVLAGVAGLQADLAKRRMIAASGVPQEEAAAEIDDHGGRMRKSAPSGRSCPPSTMIVVPVM